MQTSNLTPEEQALLEKLRAKEQQSHQAKREAYEQMRDEVVSKYVFIFKQEQVRLSLLKKQMFEEVEALIDLMHEYGHVKSGQRNYTITSATGDKIEVASAKLSKYNELAEMAAQKIKEFVKSRFTNDSDADFILSLLDKNEKGKFSEQKIQVLYKHESRYEAQEWREAIALFKESYQQIGTKEYIRVHKALESGGTVNLHLDFAKL